MPAWARTSCSRAWAIASRYGARSCTSVRLAGRWTTSHWRRKSWAVAQKPMADEYHDPVLLQACLEGLNIRKDGVYVDVTFGGGGHSKAILERLGPFGRLIAFDRDRDAWKNAPVDERFTLVKADFRWLKNHLRFLHTLPVDGL